MAYFQGVECDSMGRPIQIESFSILGGRKARPFFEGIKKNLDVSLYPRATINFFVEIEGFVNGLSEKNIRLRYALFPFLPLISF